MTGSPAPRSSAPREVMLLASDAESINGYGGIVHQLRLLGHRVHLGYLAGTLDRAMSGPGSRHRIGSARATRGRVARRAAVRVHQSALLTAGRVLPTRTALRLAVRHDPWFRRAARTCSLAIGLDEDAAASLEGARVDGVLARHGPRDAPAVLAELLLRSLAEASPSGPLTAAQSRAVCEAAPFADDSLADLVPGLLLRISLGGHHEEALAAARTLAARRGEDPPLAAALASAELSALGATDRDVPALTAGTLAAADRALAGGDVHGAAVLATLALGLLFHRELHVDAERTPLVDDPAGHLACLAGSRVVDALRAPVPPPERPSRVTHAAAVVLLPGSYGRFSRGVAESLAGRAEVRVVDLGLRDPVWRGVGVNPQLVETRLRRGLGLPVESDLELEEDLADAAVVFVDWADRGAVWASLTAPEGTRLVLRVHSVDALSPWIHLVDWTRVDDVVVVSEHVRSLVVDLLGDRLATTGVHVVPNVVDVERFSAPKAEGAAHTLAVVGWAQRVKDPLWALELLVELRRTDPRWRLLLIGADFAPTRVRTSLDHAGRFRSRALEDDVRDHVEYVGYTTRLEDHLARAGWVVSSSVRESCPVGATEGALSGAVPVVRDWPVFARRGGAAGVFGAEHVVASVAEAAGLVRRVESEGWQEASQRTRAWARETLVPVGVAETYRELLLSPPAGNGRPG